jgi:hypothetical protein
MLDPLVTTPSPSPALRRNAEAQQGIEVNGDWPRGGVNSSGGRAGTHAGVRSRAGGMSGFRSVFDDRL